MVIGAGLAERISVRCQGLGTGVQSVNGVRVLAMRVNTHFVP